MVFIRNLPSIKLSNFSVVQVPVDGVTLTGELVVPRGSEGLVIFAHGSGQRSPRNRFVAQKLQHGHLATLLIDLLTAEEAPNYRNRLDIDLLTERLAAITDWAAHNSATEHLSIGYFGTSTGAAAALVAANTAADTVKAVVSRGGRVDLANSTIVQLQAPTLLIVDQKDHAVRRVNEEVFLKLHCKRKLAEIPNTVHAFEEPSALGRAAELASEWFSEHLKEPDHHTSAGSVGLKVVAWLVAIVAMGGLVYGTYIWQHREVDRLNQQITQLNRQLATARQQTPMTANVYASPKGVRIIVYAPAKNSPLASPAVVIGQVPGNWSFEASFPVKILDSKGNVVAQAPAQLLADWMTDKLVAFSAKLTYGAAASGNGTLVLQKDNPSGLPANDDAVSIPIKL